MTTDYSWVWAALAVLVSLFTVACLLVVVDVLVDDNPTATLMPALVAGVLFVAGVFAASYAWAAV